MLKRSLQLIALSLFLNFCLLAAISVPTLAQGPLPTPSPTPSANSSLSADDTTPSDPEATTTGRGIINVRPPDTVVDPAAPPTPQGGGFGTAVTSFGRAKVQDRFAPTRNPRLAIPIWGSHLNAILNGFAFGAGLGLGMQLTSADSIPGVEFRFTAITSTKLYRLFEGEVYLPHVFSEKNHADIWFQYMRRTKDNFFGIGPRIPNTAETNYDIESRSFFGTFQRDFEPNITGGLFIGVTDTSTYPGESTSDIPFNFLFSGDPIRMPRTACFSGVQNPVVCWAPGFQHNTKILSYGAFGEVDLRNNERGLTRGFYLYGRIGSYDGLDLDNAFSDYGWVGGGLDARGYIPIYKDRTVLAVRNQFVLQKTKGGSQIPFYNLAFLGGREYVRGFRDYRFRGNNMLMFSAELRQTVYAIKEDRGIDVFAFGDTGQVWGDNRSQNNLQINPLINAQIIANPSFDSSNWRASMGGGFQYRHSKGLAARLELGHSNERNLIYFSLSRGF
jgi:hypothetical protein